jgi:hypothetical protein
MLLSVVLCTEIWAIFGSFELDVSTFLAVSERSAEVSQQGGERQESSGMVGECEREEHSDTSAVSPLSSPSPLLSFALHRALSSDVCHSSSVDLTLLIRLSSGVTSGFRLFTNLTVKKQSPLLSPLPSPTQSCCPRHLSSLSLSLSLRDVVRL